MPGHQSALAGGMALAAAIGAVVALLLRGGPSARTDLWQPPEGREGQVETAVASALRDLEARVRALESAGRADATRTEPTAPVRATAESGAGVGVTSRRPATSPPGPAAPPREEVDPASLPLLSASPSRAELHARYGEPEREDKHADGSARLHFLSRGLRVELDSIGRVEKIRYFGRAETQHTNQAGRHEGLFRSDTEWYHPRTWTMDDVSIGMHASEIYRRWGDPDQNIYGQHGEEWAIYAKRHLRLELDREHRLIHIEYDPELK